MTVVAFELERVVAAELDGPLVSLGSFRLVRSDTGLSIELGPDLIADATAMLARAGMRIASRGSALSRRPGMVAAVVPHLDPIVSAGVVDALHVRALGAGEATARLARRSYFRRRPDDGAVRAVLAGTDRAFVWSRIVFARPRAIRALRGVRPVVFDRGALDRHEERIAFVGASALTRWVG